MKKHTILAVFMLFSAAAFSQALPSYVPTGNLELWYSFNGGAIDGSANALNGTVTGASPTTDRFGSSLSAYSFNGTSNYISLPPSTSLDLVKEVTIMAWIKCDNYGTSISQIFWRGNTLSAYDPYMLFITGGAIRFRRNVATGTATYDASIPVSIVDTSKYHMIVGTFSILDDSMKIYYDGKRYAAVYAPTPIAYSTTGFWNMIGAVDYGTWQFYKGKIDDVGAWNRRLSDCEISKLYYANNSLIMGNPSSTYVASGGTATFSIADSGGIATYQWQVNAGAGFTDVISSGSYSGSNTMTLTINPVTAAMNVNSYRCIRDAGACIDTSVFAVLTTDTTSTPDTTTTTDTTLSVSTQGNSDDLMIVPNPGNGSFRFSGMLSNGLTEIGSIEILDLLGRRVYESEIHIDNGTITGAINLNGTLNQGSYIVVIHSPHTYKTYKLVVC
ncbi:hypothetical protein CJD36_001260 [Flavipsychrobacter stenotrophus]|uniref:LamG-like jellyroll fold domain-containing protein n=1 Tax=Flavipsychrobacter stenotrophus TaxID=2077091 RepID=A0A2S7T0F2_9BACT|nr:LamG-like jellyroll fold domain-containing protein [Flavipsychrobacter stenotrophus]PQJ12408.1 hypothetical protein CJD36_001260 [Flavipsychrobacter stenotrophus]